MMAYRRILLAISALLLATLACAQAGKVITDAQATQTAIPTATVVIFQLDAAAFEVGDKVVIIGGKFGALVPLYGSACAQFFSSQVLHGTDVEVLGLLDCEGNIWYQIEGLIGQGWLLVDNIVSVEEFEILEAEKLGTPRPTE
ncbi:MAG: hypothetical protein IIC79_04110 [Chloroflexi bacterium]|nr:hypothetical protein [Chloroflexota bacterium]